MTRASERGETKAGIVGGMESCRMRGASLMKYGLLAEELVFRVADVAGVFARGKNEF